MKTTQKEYTVSPWRLFGDWMFDSDMNKEIHPDLLKYNSPITLEYALKMFTLNPRLTQYLNKVFNNVNLYYLDKKELFLFLKKCVIDNKMQRNMVAFIPYKKKEKLFTALRSKIPNLKNYDLNLLCELIDKDEEHKQGIYLALGLEKDEKITKIKKVKKEKKNQTIDEFIKEHFQINQVSE